MILFLMNKHYMILIFSILWFFFVFSEENIAYYATRIRRDFNQTPAGAPIDGITSMVRSLENSIQQVKMHKQGYAFFSIQTKPSLWTYLNFLFLSSLSVWISSSWSNCIRLQPCCVRETWHSMLMSKYSLQSIKFIWMWPVERCRKTVE